MFSFKGVHPQYNKITSAKAIKVAKLPSKVIIPLKQYDQSDAKPLVKVGQKVKAGQKIASGQSFLAVDVHASISGKVTDICLMPHPVIGEALSVVIESDGKIEFDSSIKERKKEPNSDEIKKIIKEAGIVGLGGAMFPTHVKLTPPKGKILDTLIVNGAECEPYITADHRLMLEHSHEIIEGIKIIMKATNVKKAIIGVEDNKKDAINKLNQELKNEKNIEVKSVKTRYPAGAEKNLIKDLINREVPFPGIPADVGVIVDNITTIKAIYDAVKLGKPLIERVVTVTGAIKSPENYLVKLGVLFKDLIQQSNGYSGNISKLINGGPMMGITQYTDEVPIIKGTSCILALSEAKKYDPLPCIRCGKCIEVCPMKLMPTSLALNAEHKKFDVCNSLSIFDCYECGACSYVCPSKIPLVQWIKYGKAEIKKEKK